MLAWLLERMLAVDSVEALVVATSERIEDSAVVAFAQSMGVPCYRGPHDDVLARLLAAALHHQLDAVVRVNGDSPFLDPAIVDKAVRLFMLGSADIVTNVWPRTFPKGQSVEVIDTASLQEAAANATAEEREHVTTHFYANPKRFRICNFTLPRPTANVQLSVDTEADFSMAEAMLRSMDRPPKEFDLESLLVLRSRVMSAQLSGAHKQ